MGFVAFDVHNCKITHSGPMNAENAAALEQVAAPVRTYLRQGDCDRLYQEFFQALHAELSSEDFAPICNDMSAEYQVVESATQVSTHCETTRYLFKGEEYGNCVVNYRLALNDGTTVREIHELYLENGEYQLIGFYWPEEEEQASN